MLNRTYLVTGSIPESGGALGRYMTKGKSSVAVGSQPKNVGLALTPVLINSSGVEGVGGNVL